MYIITWFHILYHHKESLISWIFYFREKVLGLAYAAGCKQLLTGSEDCIIGIWNMDIDRQEVKTDWPFTHVYIYLKDYNN